jgi:hypothetical protein
VRYLGESEELACVHRFADAAGDVHELRVTPVVGLDLHAAVDLHEHGEFDASHTADWLPERTDAWLSSSGDWRWALLGGWSATRRLSWAAHACPSERMQPVLLAMADAPADIEHLSALPRLPDALALVEVPPTSSLARLRDAAPIPVQPFPLPRHAASLIDASLSAAAHEDLAGLLALVRPDARWGLPDRRQLGARPITDERGQALLGDLRRVLARMPADAQVNCPILDRRAEPIVRRGEAAMWCVWASENHLDLLVFAVRGETRDGHVDARIEYIGLFPEPPHLPLRVPGEPPPPPWRVQPQLLCGDPHAPADVCPRDELEEDDDDASAPEPEDEPEPTDDEPEPDSAVRDEVGPASLEQLFHQFDVPGIRDLDRQQHGPDGE